MKEVDAEFGQDQMSNAPVPSAVSEQADRAEADVYDEDLCDVIPYRSGVLRSRRSSSWMIERQLHARCIKTPSHLPSG